MHVLYIDIAKWVAFVYVAMSMHKAKAAVKLYMVKSSLQVSY